MTRTLFSIFALPLAFGLQSGNANENPKPRTVPEPPSGYILDPDPNSPETLLERMRLDEIFRTKRDKWHDQGVQSDLNTQIKRMLLKDDVSRAELLRWYFAKFAAKKSFDQDVDNCLSANVLSFMQKLESERFSGQRIEEPAHTDMLLRAKHLEFARLYFEILKPAGLSLDSPADDFKNIFAKYTQAELEQIANPLCRKAAAYLRRTAISGDVAKYLAVVCALAGFADEQLPPMEAYFRIKSERKSGRQESTEIADTIRGAMEVSEWIRADRKAPLSDLLVKALESNQKTRQFARFMLRYLSKGIDVKAVCKASIEGLKQQDETEEIVQTLRFLDAACNNPAAFYSFPKPTIEGADVLFGF